MKGPTLDRQIAEGLALGLEPSVLLNTLQLESRPSERPMLAALQNGLSVGRNLDDLLADRPDVFSERLRGAVEAGLRSGRLKKAAAAYLSTIDESNNQAAKIVAAVVYPMLLIAGLVWVFGFRSIGYDDLPPVLQNVSIAGETAWKLWGFVWIGMGMLVVMAILVAAALFRPRALVSILCLLPGARGVVRRRLAATVADTVALLLVAGERLPVAIRCAARTRMAGRSAHRLDAVAEAIARGLPPEQSTVCGGPIGRTLKEAFVAGVASGNLVDALKRKSATLRREAGRLQDRSLKAYLWVVLGTTTILIAVALFRTYMPYLAYPHTLGLQ